MVLRVAQRLNHPDLARLLPVLARSRSPEVREVIATLWRERPDLADAEALAALTLDPAAGVRRAAARAASAIRAWGLLDRLAEDPDPSVRRQAALSIGAARQPNPETDAVLGALADDIAMPVRAAAFAARLVQGVPVAPPPGVELREVAAALRESADLTTLRETARTASDENQRLAAALALALLQDEVAHEIARTDPFPSIRHRVGGALELAALTRGAVSETVLRFLIASALAAQPLFLAFFLLHNTYTLVLIVLSARQVRRRVTSHFVEDLDLIDGSDLTKPLTMIVPAYNEEVTIVDSVTSLVECEYPRFEIIVINDGSTDRTLERLGEAFGLRRTDLPYRGAIATAPVRAMYEATVPLPAIRHSPRGDRQGERGKADALNAGINASTAPFIVSLDADSILDEHALKELMRVIHEDPRVVAVGGQVAIANGCSVSQSRVIEVGLPARPLARFQMVEYLRSFTTGRTGLDLLSLCSS